MVPDAMTNYFIASTGASAALVGLIFVAISLAPQKAVTRGSNPVWRAVAGSSFLALINIFFISISALNTNQNLGLIVLIMSLVGLSDSFSLGLPLVRKVRNWRRFIAQMVMTLLSLSIYGAECFYAIRLLIAPSDIGAVNAIASLLLYVYGIGLVRAWELLGAERLGLLRWLNPLQEEDDEESSS
jgi:hypothetical protein